MILGHTFSLLFDLLISYYDYHMNDGFRYIAYDVGFIANLFARQWHHAGS